MKRILWTIAILIIPPFVFWGAGSALRSKQKGPTYAGTIFGRKISFEGYSASWQAAKNQALLIYGSRLNEIYDNLNLDKQAWDRLILLTEAKKRRIKVPDQEVIDTIQNFPFLQSSGQFDKRAYDLILAQVFRITARQFEEEIRDFLTISKLRDSIIQNVGITNKEVKDTYKKENEKSRIAYILISPTNFKNKVKVGQKAVKRYYEDNAESFRIPEQVNVEYLGFEFSDYQKDVQIADEEIKNYYDKHKDEFDPKKELKDLKDAVKNKLVQNAAKEKALLAAEKIDYILADKAKGFEEVAKENSIPIKESGFFAKQGPIPQIGWFPDIQKIAFKLKAGERSELIKSDMEFVRGYYIIKLKGKKASYIPPLEEVKEKIEDIIKDEGAVTLAAKEAKRLHKRVLELVKMKKYLPAGRQVKFEDAVSKIMHRPKYTEPFARNDYIPGIGLASELGEAAFNTKAGDISPIIKTRAGCCIFTVTEITPINEKKFKKERKEFATRALETKKTEALNNWYSDLMKRANLKSNIPLEK